MESWISKIGALLMKGAIKKVKKKTEAILEVIIKILSRSLSSKLLLSKL